MKLLRHIGNILLQSETEYAEFLLGTLSLFTGLWLFFPACHALFDGAHMHVAPLSPELWGGLLTFAGATKFIGVMLQSLPIRKLSCFIAIVVWLFLGTLFIQNNPTLCRQSGGPLAPMMLTLACFNGAIYVKLQLHHHRW